MLVSKYFVIEYLLAQPAIAAIVGARIYPRWLSAAEILPAAVVKKVSESRELNLDGDSKLASTTVDIYCIGKKDEEMEAVKLAIINALHGKFVTTDETKAHFRLINDFDVDDDLEEVSHTGVLVFDINWSY